jgi:predicted nuclease of predicted toxin-antitoxin system
VASLYLDNDVSLRLLPFLQQAGHDVVATRDLVYGRATDDSQLLVAFQNRRILVTYNRADFILLHDAWQSWPPALGLTFPPHLGVLILDHASPESQSGALVTILASNPAMAFSNNLY